MNLSWLVIHVARDRRDESSHNPVRELRLVAGAGFVAAICGETDLAIKGAVRGPFLRRQLHSPSRFRHRLFSSGLRRSHAAHAMFDI